MYSITKIDKIVSPRDPHGLNVQPDHVERMAHTVNFIIDNPHKWDQTIHHGDCDVACCFAGWVQIHSGMPKNPKTAHSDAERYLGFGGWSAHYWFGHKRTLSDLIGLVNGSAKACGRLDLIISN